MARHRPIEQLRRSTAGIAAALALGTLLAGAAAVPSRAQDAAAMSPAEQALYQKAKAEGAVSIWAPVSREVSWIPAEFAKRYPGVKVTTVGDLQGGIKIISEARAGSPTADVWVTSIGDMLQIQKRGLLADTDWSLSKTLQSNIFFGGQAAAFHNFVYCILYAKDKVKESELPDDWQDLLDPKWKGRLVASDFLLPRLMGYFGIAWGPDKTEQWGKALISGQKTLITNAPRQNFLRTGERVVSVAEPTDAAYSYTQDGVPTGYHLMKLTPAGQFAVAAIKGGPHPAAATLLANWLASEEGKRLAFVYNHESDIRPGATSALAKEIKEKGIKVIFEDAENVDERAAFYKQFSPLVRGQ